MSTKNTTNSANPLQVETFGEPKSPLYIEVRRELVSAYVLSGYGIVKRADDHADAVEMAREMYAAGLAPLVEEIAAKLDKEAQTQRERTGRDNGSRGDTIREKFAAYVKQQSQSEAPRLTLSKSATTTPQECADCGATFHTQDPQRRANLRT